MNPILKAKKRFKSIYLMRLGEDHFCVFGLMKWGDFKSYRNLLSVFPEMSEDIKDDVIEQCVVEYVSPSVMYKSGDLTEEDREEGWVPFFLAKDFWEAGAFEAIFSSIWRLSGVENHHEMFADLDGVRPYAQMNVEDRIMANVMAVTKYKTEDFEAMTWQEILPIIAQSELLLGGQALSAPFHLEEEDSKKKHK